MLKRSPVYVQCLASIALLAPSLVIAAEPAAGKQLRVKISLEVKGSYQNTGAVKHGTLVRASIDNSYSVEYVVPAETVLTGLQKTNPLDPASQKEMEEYNAKVKAREDRIYHSADNLRKPSAAGGAQPGGNPIAMPSPEMMAKIKACGTDQACKQQIAMEMMSQQMPKMPSGPNVRVQADIQAISDMCAKKGKIGTKAHEDCMNAEGRKRSTVPPSAADDEPEVAELPDRYFLYRVGVESIVDGVIDCKFKGHTKINESTTSAVADVGGMGEVTLISKGEGDANPKAFQPCANEQAVFDTKTNTFWVWRAGLQPAVVALTGNNGETMTPNSIDLPSDIGAWVSASLHGAPASGTKTQKFDYRTAKLTWSIVKE